MSDCGCKGIRSCLICEKQTGKLPSSNLLNKKSDSSNSALVEQCYIYCYLCGQCIQGTSSEEIIKEHPNHKEEKLHVDGIFLLPDFVTDKEEDELGKNIDKIPWVSSQSGRRKQDFGPKVNFKKQKLKVEAFKGFPEFAQFLIPRMQGLPELSDFIPVELCHLEYDPLRGASIDPHLDDTWLWGERLVTVSLLSDTYLWLQKVDGENSDNRIIKIPMWKKSLLVIKGEARYKYTHGIFREDITGKRFGMTWRELTKEVESTDEGKGLLERAKWTWKCTK